MMATEVHPGPIELRVSSDEREDYRKLCQLTNTELSQYVKELSAATEEKQNINLLRAAQELLIERSPNSKKATEDEAIARAEQAVALGIRLGKIRRKHKAKESWLRVAWIIFITLGVICLPALLVGPFESSIEAVTHRSFPTSPISVVAVSSVSIVVIFTLVGMFAGIIKDKENAYLSFFGGTFPITGKTYGSLCNKIVFWNLITTFVFALLGLSILFTGWCCYFNLIATMWWPFFLMALGLWCLVSLWIIATALLLEYTDIVPNWIGYTKLDRKDKVLLK